LIDKTKGGLKGNAVLDFIDERGDVLRRFRRNPKSSVAERRLGNEKEEFEIAKNGQMRKSQIPPVPAENTSVRKESGRDSHQARIEICYWQRD